MHLCHQKFWNNVLINLDMLALMAILRSEHYLGGILCDHSPGCELRRDVWYCLVLFGFSWSFDVIRAMQQVQDTTRDREMPQPLPKDHLIAELRRSYSPDVKEAAGNSETVPGLCHRTS